MGRITTVFAVEVSTTIILPARSAIASSISISVSRLINSRPSGIRRTLSLRGIHSPFLVAVKTVVRHDFPRLSRGSSHLLHPPVEMYNISASIDHGGIFYGGENTHSKNSQVV